MKAFAFCSIIFSLIFNNCYARKFYLSSITGDDHRSIEMAQNAATPWRSLAKLNNMMPDLQTGDEVLFKRGEVFFGTLIVKQSGLTFGAFGEGKSPEITGFITITDWENRANHIWRAALKSGVEDLNMVVLDGLNEAPGRWPNANQAGGGYFNYQNFNGKTTITDKKLIGHDFTGADLVMRKTRWVIDRNKITSQQGATLNYTSGSGYGGANGYGYFVQNHPATLDQNGEWFYNAAAQTLEMYFGATPQNHHVSVSTVATLLSIAGQQDIRFSDILFSGAGAAAVELNAVNNIRFADCEIRFSGRDAFKATACDHLTIQNSEIRQTYNNAITLNDCTNALISHNRIMQTGMFAGLGGNGDGTYEAMLISGNDNEISNNVIDSTGYIPLTFNGNGVLVKNNLVKNYALTKDDGGGIYTWNNSAGAKDNTGRIISGNIILNGAGAPYGTDNTTKAYAHGIYLDDNSAGVKVVNNTVATCASFGVYIHNAHNIDIKNNTLYDNAVQLEMEHDQVAADKPIYNCTITGNILFAKTQAQLPAEYKTKDNDIKKFGAFNHNVYNRPLANDLLIGVLQQVNGKYSYVTYNLSAWQKKYGKDIESRVPGNQIPSFSVTKVTGANRFLNGNFNANIGGLYVYSAANNGTVKWDNTQKLDGGALKIAFSPVTGNSGYASVIIGIGAVTSGRQYRLKFDLLGTNSDKTLSTYLRRSGGNYGDLSARQALTITGGRNSKDLLFTANSTENDASIVFDAPEQNSAIYLDNIVLEPVDAKPTNPNNLMHFFYNSAEEKQQIIIKQAGRDINGLPYQNSAALDPFSSLILISSLTDCVEPLSKPVIVAN